MSMVVGDPPPGEGEGRSLDPDPATQVNLLAVGKLSAYVERVVNIMLEEDPESDSAKTLKSAVASKAHQEVSPKMRLRAFSRFTITIHFFRC